MAYLVKTYASKDDQVLRMVNSYIHLERKVNNSSFELATLRDELNKAKAENEFLLRQINEQNNE